MLQRTTHPNGVVTYQSPLLRAAGITHAFSTRIGGISMSPYDSLNLGNPQGGAPDPAAHIQENFRRLQSAIAAADLPRASVHQVHGSTVELLAPEPDGEYAETLDAEIRDRFSGQTSADGMVTSVPGVLLTIRVADCVPVLLATQNGIVAALHAGWRGVVSGVIENGLKLIRNLSQISPESIPNLSKISPESIPNEAQLGTNLVTNDAKSHTDLPQNNGVEGAPIPSQMSANSSAFVTHFDLKSTQLVPNLTQKKADYALNNELLAAIGPGISVANFEVGEEVAAEFEARGLGAAVVRQSGQNPHVDLPRAIREILERNGVKRIDSNNLCTFRDTAEFYSHRRDKGRTGRMVAMIAARYNRPL